MAATTLTPGARGTGTEGERWQLRAACREAPTAIFFPPGNPKQPRPEEERAKTLCSFCPVRPRCLAFAVDHAELYGIWGGLNAEERRGLASADRAIGGTDA